MQEALGTQLAMNYIGRKQGTVAQWVDLKKLFICVQERRVMGEEDS